MDYCWQALPTRSKYSEEGLHRCWKPAGHSGRCSEYPFLSHLRDVADSVARKIKRDSRMTTGAAWDSDDAGPNRIRRWVMLKSDEELLEQYGLDMQSLKPWVRAKLREKAAPYTDCMEVAISLTWQLYGMENAPEPPADIREYLEEHFGPIEAGYTGCLICTGSIDFNLFQEARRGYSPIETAHGQPREHKPENVGFAHRRCNIAQGSKTLDEFYDWIEGILRRVGRL